MAFWPTQSHRILADNHPIPMLVNTGRFQPKLGPISTSDMWRTS
uniref:Uncharacterized protein MANES_15G134200 n=1 Tax=Rhizophora mucronata TaxID=61149 RepID=A0A2P2K9Q9_RHIMU